MIRVSFGLTSPQGGGLTLTGSGTFPNVQNKCRKDVTGGGTWSIMMTPTSDPRCFMGSGTYRVVELLSWTPAASAFPLRQDNIGEIEDATAGLVKLRVAYDNGTRGVLTVSCHLNTTPPSPTGAPDCMFEGITASMAWEDFSNREAPRAGVDENRTVFHFVHK